MPPIGQGTRPQDLRGEKPHGSGNPSPQTGGEGREGREKKEEKERDGSGTCRGLCRPHGDQARGSLAPLQERAEAERHCHVSRRPAPRAPHGCPRARPQQRRSPAGPAGQGPLRTERPGASCPGERGLWRDRPPASHKRSPRSAPTTPPGDGASPRRPPLTHPRQGGGGTKSSRAGPALPGLLRAATPSPAPGTD